MANFENQVLNWPSNKTIVLGVSGNGKTTLFKKLIKREKARVVFVFDHQGEFAPFFGVDPVYTMDELCEATAKGGYVCFDPILFAGKKKAAFKMFCEFVFETSKEIKGRKLLVVDEAHKCAEDKKDPVELLTICDTGRRLQIDLWLIAQSLNQLHCELRNQIRQIYTFRQGDKIAVENLEERGFNGEDVRNLKPGQWIWRNLDTGETTKGGSAFEINTTGAANADPDRKRGNAKRGGGPA